MRPLGFEAEVGNVEGEEILMHLGDVIRRQHTQALIPIGIDSTDVLVHLFADVVRVHNI